MGYSFHLWWELSGQVDEVAATLEVLQAPSVDRLYFWALQASFMDSGEVVGGGHLGLQWHPEYPGHRAVNWGGYEKGGVILEGSESVLPNTLGNRNTRDFLWQTGRAYRLRIFPSPEKGWRGEITDLETGVVTVVRDLYAGGSRLAHPVVWSELFCECHDPTAAVRWSDLNAVNPNGEQVSPTGLRVNYKAEACRNTNSYPDEQGIVQATKTERTTPQGAVIPL